MHSGWCFKHTPVNGAQWLRKAGVRAGAVTALLGLPVLLGAQILREDFSRGQDAPAGWRLVQGQGRWETVEGGRRVISVTGQGQDMAYWARTVPGLKPNTTYALRFRARSLPGSSLYTVISGLDVCNRDFATSPTWSDYAFAFTTPADVTRAFLRLGQWHLTGTVQFSHVTLLPVEVVHARFGNVVLGEGESIRRGNYYFQAPLMGFGSNSSRCLMSHTAPFNSNRWVFSGGLNVVYRHAVEGFRQTSGAVTVNINYFVAGDLRVLASTDGSAWIPLGTASSQGLHRFSVPETLFPADQIYIRLEGAAATDPAGNAAPGSFQIDSYSYQAALEGVPPEATGETYYIQLMREPTSGIAVEDLGNLTRAGEGRVHFSIASPGASERQLVGRLRIARRGGNAEEFAAVREVTPGRRTTLDIPFRVRLTGDLVCRLTLARLRNAREEPLYEGELSVTVSPYYATDYGHPLTPVPDGDLWWCEATYKVPPERLPPPQIYSVGLKDIQARRGKGVLRLSAAGREREHVQLVFRPNEEPGPVQVRVSPLTGPQGKGIPASALEVREVAYVRVTQPTDYTGSIGEWPDPLPPLRGAWQPRAGRNNVLWITVTVPAGTPAGTYTGTISLQSARWTREVPIELRVYGFALPEKTALRSGFGVNPGNIVRYHNLKRPEDIAKVWDLYMEAFRKRRIAPYNPMALAPYHIEVEGVRWSGGARVTEEPASGQYCLRIDDTSTTASLSASYTKQVAVVPGRRYVLRWKCRTAQPDQQYMVTVSHLTTGRTWMSGQNNDIVRTGQTTWTEEMVDISDRIPEEAGYAHVVLRPVVWTESGEQTGTAWFDDVSLVEMETGAELLEDGGFESEPQLSVRLDFTEFDKAARRYLDGMGFNAFTIFVAGLPGGRHPHFDQGSFFGFLPGSPEYDALMTDYGTKLVDHLKKNGWLEKAYVYWYDEPEEADYPIVVEGGQRLKRYFPGLKRMMTEEFVEPLMGHVDLWCPLTAYYDREKARARQSLGEEVWWYVCTGPRAPYCTLFIDKPAIELRMWLWQTWQRQIQGILIWETTWWTSPNQFPDERVQNPWEDPMAYVAAPTGVWGNGDGRFFYPPNRDPNGDRVTAYVEGPIDSIRWEMLGEGIEDWEYFRLLETLVRREEARGRSDALVRRARQLLQVPPEITSDLTKFTTDPQKIYRHRQALAEAIEALQTPRPAASPSRQPRRGGR